MSIRYEIHPGLNLLIYLFEGACSAKEYFNLYHTIYQNDERRHHGMKILMDLSTAELELDVESLKEAKSIVSSNKEKGYSRDQVVFLSKGIAMKRLAETFRLLADGLTLDLEVANNIYDALRWLGLVEAQEEEAIRFWRAFIEAGK